MTGQTIILNSSHARDTARRLIDLAPFGAVVMAEPARKPSLSVVPPPSPEPVDIAKQWREEIRQRDWGKVHIEGNRSAPVFLSFLRWVHRL